MFKLMLQLAPKTLSSLIRSSHPSQAQVWSPWNLFSGKSVTLYPTPLYFMDEIDAALDL